MNIEPIQSDVSGMKLTKRLFRAIGPGGLMCLVLALAACLPARLALAQQQQLNAETLTKAVVPEDGPHRELINGAIEKFKKAQFDAARADLVLAKEKKPELPPAEIIMVQLFFAAKQNNAVREELERAVNENPADPEAYATLADISLRGKRIAAADLLYAKSYHLLGEFKENHFRKKAIAIRIFSGWAQVKGARKKWKDARLLLEKWRKLEPKNMVPLQGLSQAQFQDDDKELAYKTLQAAQKLDTEGTSLPPEVTMASFYYQTGDKENMRKYIGLAMKQSGSNIKARVIIGRMLLQSGDVEQARSHADAAVQQDGDDIDALMLLGIVARMQGDNQIAIRQLETVAAASPSNIIATNVLAMLLADQEDPKSRRRALELAQVNVNLSKSNAAALATLGWALYRNGRVPEAERQFNLVLQQRQPLNADILYFIASVLNSQGKKADASKLLTRALATKGPFAYEEKARKLLATLPAAPDEPITP